MSRGKEEDKEEDFSSADEKSYGSTAMDILSRLRASKRAMLCTPLWYLGKGHIPPGYEICPVLDLLDRTFYQIGWVLGYIGSPLIATFLTLCLSL